MGGKSDRKVRFQTLNCIDSEDEATEAEGSVREFSPEPSPVVSKDQFSDPGETLIFLDWDDTLFPISELLDCFGSIVLSPQASNCKDGSDAESGQQRLRRSSSGTELLPSRPLRRSFSDDHLQRAPRLRMQTAVSAAAAMLGSIARLTFPNRMMRFGGSSRQVVLERQIKEALSEWAEVLEDYLAAVTALSDRVVIITNARPPWVEECFERFAPRLSDLLVFGTPGGANPPRGKVKVIYARDHYESLKARGQVVGNLDKDRQITMAKFNAMRSEARAFYRRGQGHTLTNVLNFGDMQYEHEAVRELEHSRRSAHDQCRIKSVLLPASPTITGLVLRLRLETRLLSAFVNYDGSFDLNLQTCTDPFREISNALRMPDLLETNVPRLAWDRSEREEDPENIERALRRVEQFLKRNLN